MKPSNYLEKKGYTYTIRENGDMNAYEKTTIFKDGKFKESKVKSIIEGLDNRGVALLSEISKPDFIVKDNSITSEGDEETKAYQMEILEDGQIQVRCADIVLKDGIEISRTYHRKVLSPNDDVTKEPKKIKKISSVVWTPEVVSDFVAAKSAALETP